MRALLWCLVSVMMMVARPALVEPEAGPAQSEMARDVLAEINQVRTRPRSYIPMLREHRSRFRGSVLHRPGQIDIQTFEGPAAVDEAIRFLERQAPLPALIQDTTLDIIAREHVRDQGISGALGHYGHDGRDFTERLRRRGADPWGGENISYGYDTAREVVIQLLVDDAVPDRGHRTNLFRAAYVRAGADCGPHRLYGHMCVIDFGY